MSQIDELEKYYLENIIKKLDFSPKKKLHIILDDFPVKKVHNEFNQKDYFLYDISGMRLEQSKGCERIVDRDYYPKKVALPKQF